MAHSIVATGNALIANHHTAPIALPRRGAVGMNLHPLVFNPGAVTSVDREEWNERKKSASVQGYLDVGLLSEVRSATQSVAVTEVTTSNPEIPENLQTEEEQKYAANPDGAPITAKVRKSNITHTNIG